MPPIQFKPPTQCLADCMEMFGESEPQWCIVIWVNEAGEICRSCSTTSNTINLGMCELTAELIKKEVCK